jgi:predicted aspartyl protease
MGRKYVNVKIFFENRSIEDLNAFIDTGSDLTIISTEIARRLRIKIQNIERKWTASDGDERQSPITEIKIQEKDKKEAIFLDEVLIDDAPLDPENNEDVIIGLDYLQKAKIILSFDD